MIDTITISRDTATGEIKVTGDPGAVDRRGEVGVMKERPLLFSGGMIRAILSGTKTQTRRVVKPQPQLVNHAGGASWRDAKADLWRNQHQHARDCCPYGVPGDRLWVREAWRPCGPWEEPQATVAYRADGAKREVEGFPPSYRIPNNSSPDRWRQSIHMPRWASRITLEIADVRVERLNSISEADAMAEGLIEWSDPPRVSTKHYGVTVADAWETDPRKAYARLWDQINGKTPEHSWESNPWVWCVSFRRVEPEKASAGK